MKYSNKILFLFIASCLNLFSITHIIYAQDSSKTRELRKILRVKNPVGQDFWLCFEKNFKNDQTNNNEILLELFITGDYDSKVKVEIDGLHYIKEINLPAETVVNVKIDPGAQVLSSEVPERLAVHVTSDKPISVYGLNRRFQSTDTYLGLPTQVLGTEYRVMGYVYANSDLLSQFAIVATEDSTMVTIIPTVNTTYHPKDIPFIVKLRRGDVYQVVSRYENIGKLDLTGTLIKSNKKIAVFSGHQCAYVPQYIIACNHLVEELPPVPSWGRHFYIGMFKSRSKYTYRVLANENKTRVFEDSKLIKTLKAGEYYENQSSKNLQITADKPVLVAQYSQGFQNGDSIGDPMMLFISPTQQFLQQYRFATPINGQWKHYINVVVPTKAIGTLKLDGFPVDTSVFEPLGISRYSIGFIRIPFGTHFIEGDMPFGMYSYGFGYGGDAYDAYGNMGGQSFQDYEPVKDTLPPLAEIAEEGNKTELIFRDDRQDDTGIKDIVLLESSGLNVSIPKFDEGILQVPVDIKLTKTGAIGRAVFEATDVGLNKSVFTLCYSSVGKSKAANYSLVEGNDPTCIPAPGWLVGIFGKLSVNTHTTDFSNTGGLASYGKFSDATGIGGWGGIYFGREIYHSVIASARLSFENYGGTLTAPGQIDSVRDEITQKLVPYQEEKELTLNALYTHLSLAAEWHFDNYFYLLGGLNFALNLSNSITVKDKIIMPYDRVFSNGSNEQTDPTAPATLSSLNSFRAGLFLGLGMNYVINNLFTGFAEAQYTYHLGNIISDGNWSLQQFSIILGLRITI